MFCRVGQTLNAVNMAIFYIIVAQKSLKWINNSNDSTAIWGFSEDKKMHDTWTENGRAVRRSVGELQTAWMP